MRRVNQSIKKLPSRGHMGCRHSASINAVESNHGPARNHALMSSVQSGSPSAVQVRTTVPHQSRSGAPHPRLSTAPARPQITTLPGTAFPSLSSTPGGVLARVIFAQVPG